MADPIPQGSAGMQNWLMQLLTAQQTQGGLPPLQQGNFQMPPPMPTRNPMVPTNAAGLPEPPPLGEPQQGPGMAELAAAMKMLGGPTGANAAPMPVTPNPAEVPMAPGTAPMPGAEALPPPRFAPGPHAIPPEGPGLRYGGSTGFGGIPQMHRTMPPAQNMLRPWEKGEEDVGAALTGSGGSPAPVPFRRPGW